MSFGVRALCVGVLLAGAEPQALTAEPQRCTLVPAALPAQPPHFPNMPLVAHHTASALGVALGRALFFDARLSSTHKVACASCHDPAHAYSIPEARPTRGVTGHALQRSAPALINLAWSTTGLFWDGGAKNLESLALGPLTHEDEMGRSLELDSLIAELSADAVYGPCFREVFGAEEIKLGYVLDALAQYQRSLVFASSRWDEHMLGAQTLTAAERHGEQVFARDCARCHTPPLFTDHGFHNNGLDAALTGSAMSATKGRMRVTQRPEDLGKFKTPSLRELGRSAPYMHDGRFESIAQVIEHYRHGLRDSETLDQGFRSKDRAPAVAMSDAEAEALEAYLHALESH